MTDTIGISIEAARKQIEERRRFYKIATALFSESLQLLQDFPDKVSESLEVAVGLAHLQVCDILGERGYEDIEHPDLDRPLIALHARAARAVCAHLAEYGFTGAPMIEAVDFLAELLDHRGYLLAEDGQWLRRDVFHQQRELEAQPA
jgi:hypothetical protein